MNDVLFDADAFLSQPTEAGFSTQVKPIPIGDYRAFVKEVGKARLLPAKESGQPDRAVLDITWSIDDPALAQSLGRQELTARQSLWLDLTVDRKLDRAEGRNMQLGRLLKALGQNGDKTWSPSKLLGAGPAVVKIFHEEDRDDSEIKYAKVKAVAKA